MAGETAWVERVSTSRHETPFKIVLVNGIPLSHCGVVCSRSSVNMDTLSTVLKADEPKPIAGMFEAYMQITLMSVSCFVPQRDCISVVGSRSSLVHDKVTIASRGDEENIIATRNAFNEPL